MKKFWQKIFNWEQWHFRIIYAPLTLLWLYYWIRSGKFWFFSNVNPSLQFSGLEGETKKEMFDQLPKESYPTTIYIQPKENFENILLLMQEVNLQFPVAVKPDIGTKGLCFRKIDNEEELKKYHNTVPFVYLIQTLVELPMEMSIFYVRYPDTTKGKITGMTAKEYLQVKGNGKSTLLQLIKQHQKAKDRIEELTNKHADNLQKIIPENEVYYLSIAGNHNRGATFKNLQTEIDVQLTNVFDEISNYTKYFYYGRFDIKTTSLDDLRKGRNIQILEFNGTGAEPNHIYDCNMSYFTALKTIATHWKYMFEIGRINYKKGIPYASFKQGKKFLKDAFAAYAILEKVEKDC
ncbi:MAG: hypothetical protein LC122_03705 [Chitinophagales bacterium]|nr:hypothetical protein [Chitinophagales bacterium]